jgi:hypothetical protein
VLLAVAAPVCFAQEPIRVETNQVVVPTAVFDKKLYAHKHDLSQQIEKDPNFWDTIAIKDLVELQATDSNGQSTAWKKTPFTIELSAFGAPGVRPNP